MTIENDLELTLALDAWNTMLPEVTREVAMQCADDSGTGAIALMKSTINDTVAALYESNYGVGHFVNGYLGSHPATAYVRDSTLFGAVITYEMLRRSGSLPTVSAASAQWMLGKIDQDEFFAAQLMKIAEHNPNVVRSFQCLPGINEGVDEAAENIILGAAVGVYALLNTHQVVEKIHQRVQRAPQN